MWPFGGFHLEVNPARSFIEPGKNLLRFFRAEHLHRVFLVARNEKEYVPCRHVQTCEQLKHGINVLQIPARHDGVDVHRKLHFVATFDDLQGAPVPVSDPPVSIVQFGTRPVQPEPYPHQSNFL